MSTKAGTAHLGALTTLAIGILAAGCSVDGAAGPQDGPALGEAESGLNMAVARHNKYRAWHDAPALTWDATLAAGAQAWADACVFDHSDGDWGENLAWGYGSYEAAIDGWYGEVDEYRWDDPETYWDSAGHFSQVVWKSTTAVGCGEATCPSTWGPQLFHVCRYLPPGNVMGGGFYPLNVERPHVRIANIGTGRWLQRSTVLDASANDAVCGGAANPRNVRAALSTMTGGYTQWLFEPAGGEYFHIVAADTGRYLQCSDTADATGTGNAIRLVVAGCGGAYAQWKKVFVDDTRYRLENKQTGLWLQVAKETDIDSGSQRQVRAVPTTATGNATLWRDYHDESCGDGILDPGEQCDTRDPAAMCDLATCLLLPVVD